MLDGNKGSGGFNFDVVNQEDSSNLTDENAFNEMTKSEQKEALGDLKDQLDVLIQESKSCKKVFLGVCDKENPVDPTPADKFLLESHFNSVDNILKIFLKELIPTIQTYSNEKENQSKIQEQVSKLEEENRDLRNQLAILEIQKEQQHPESRESFYEMTEEFEQPLKKDLLDLQQKHQELHLERNLLESELLKMKADHQEETMKLYRELHSVEAERDKMVA